MLKRESLFSTRLIYLAEGWDNMKSKEGRGYAAELWEALHSLAFWVVLICHGGLSLRPSERWVSALGCVQHGDCQSDRDFF